VETDQIIQNSVAWPGVLNIGIFFRLPNKKRYSQSISSTVAEPTGALKAPQRAPIALDTNCQNVGPLCPSDKKLAQKGPVEKYLE